MDQVVHRHHRADDGKTSQQSHPGWATHQLLHGTLVLGRTDSLYGATDSQHCGTD